MTLRKPTKPCTPFRSAEHRTFWLGPGGWTCARCHPPFRDDVETYTIPDEPTKRVADPEAFGSDLPLFQAGE